MKKSLMLLIALIGFINSFAQDYITLTNGDEIKSKVLEVNPDVIKYKNWANLDGPTYSITKSDVFMIKYINGTKDVFKTMSSPLSNTSQLQQVDKPNQTNNAGAIIAVKGEEDWEKVILTQTSSDVEGLIKKGELKESTVNLGVMMTPLKKTESKLKMKIQKDAAKIGAHIVLINPLVEGTSFSLSGIAYGYK